MKLFVVTMALAAVALTGCQKVTGPISGGSTRGRYVGVGLYHPGDMWRQMARAGAPADAAAATLADDEQIIVVLDSTSGELRQCGNLSGYCVAMNPWSKPLGAGQEAPVPLLKHAQQLADEASAAADKAAPRRSSPVR